MTIPVSRLKKTLLLEKRKKAGQDEKNNKTAVTLFLMK